MIGLRKLVMFLAGGTYDFRFSAATLLYEFRKDVMTCVLIGGALWLIDGCREIRQAGSDATAPCADGRRDAGHWSGCAMDRPRIRIEPARYSVGRFGRKLRGI